MIIPYFESKRQKLMLEADKHGLLLFDNFNGQCTDGIFQLLEGHLINSVIIPVNCTDQLQPLNFSFNIAAKTFLCSKFQMWFAKEIALQKDGEKPREPVDLWLSNMKPLGAHWLVELYDHFKANPTVLLNGFRAAGITNCLNAWFSYLIIDYQCSRCTYSYVLQYSYASTIVLGIHICIIYKINI